jgi:hypothetical protein
MSRIHATEGDTDSLYFAVAGDSSKGVHQGFEYVIGDKEFYDKHVYEWFPDPTKGKANEKKLGGLAIENEGDFMIAVAPKNYTIGILSDVDKAKKEMKGCNEKRNVHITAETYMKNVDTNEVEYAENASFGMKGGELVKYTVYKLAFSGIHTKMIVLENQSCAP